MQKVFGLIVALLPCFRMSLTFDVYRTDSPAELKECANVKLSDYDMLEMLSKRKPQQKMSMRPVINASTPLKIGVSMVLSQINEIVEKEGILRLTYSLSMKWQDEFYVFNNTMPYACVGSIYLPATKIWLPDLTLINSQHRYEVILSDSMGRARLYSNGTISYRPGGTFDSFCKFDLTYFPLDEQTCTLSFESSRYTTDLQQYYFNYPPISLAISRETENEQWSLISYYSYHTPTSVSNADYDVLQFTFTFRRKVGYYLVNIIIPSLVISLAQIAVFFLAVDEVLKVHISFTCLLAYGVFQLMIIADMPRSSDTIPLLTLYITLSMGYILLAILGEGVVFECLKNIDDKHGTTERDVPSLLLKLVKWLAPLCLISNSAASNGVGANHKGTKSQTTEGKAVTPKKMSAIGMLFARLPALMKLENPSQETGDDLKTPRLRWRFVARVIDRLTFILYIASTAVTPIALFGIMPLFAK